MQEANSESGHSEGSVINTEALSSETLGVHSLQNGGSKQAASVEGGVELALQGKIRADEMTVVKRNGMLVPFRRDRVVNAIESAWRATKNIPVTEPLPAQDYQTVHKVSDQVVLEAQEQALQGACLTVEGIQDIVEAKLMEAECFDVGKNYIIYRNEQKELRQDSPRNLKVLRRDGKKFVRFNPMKIASAIERSLRDTRKVEGPTPRDVIDLVNVLANKVVSQAVEMAKRGTQLQVELLQDEVERQMMAAGLYDEAKDFILYRAKKAALRQEALRDEALRDEAIREELKHESAVEEKSHEEKHYTIRLISGEEAQIAETELRRRTDFACANLSEVSSEEVLQDALVNFYEGIKQSEVDQALMMSARAKVEREPNYSFVTARLLLDMVYRETIGCEANSEDLQARHREAFFAYIDRGIELERLSPVLKKFDLERLADAIDLSRDLDFSYLGLQTVYDRYLTHHEERRIESPQMFWMRVAMGLSIEEDDINARAIEFYDVLSQFYFVSSTPTLFNSGTCHSQMSSCYLSTTMDDLSHIFKVVADDAQLSKWAGGLGNDWTNVRATGSRIQGTNGKSQGVIPFLKVANDTAVAVNQGGKRKGAMCAYLETWHLDIEDFLELRKNTGDERRRTHDMNTANWIPDLFMERVEQNGEWTLFSPSDVPDLHDMYGTRV